MKNQDPVPSESAKQCLRDAFAQIISDFDRKEGAFAELDYHSPHILASQELSRRSGRTVAELREAISQKRIANSCGLDFTGIHEQVYNDLKAAVQAWCVETGYKKPPTVLTHEMRRFENRKQMKQHLVERWSELPFDDTLHEADGRGFAAFGRFNDPIGHRVKVYVEVKTGYGGPIHMSFDFPYYELGEPSRIGLGYLTAEYVFGDLGLQLFPELKYIAGKSKTEFPELDKVLDFTKAMITYFLPSETPVTN